MSALFRSSRAQSSIRTAVALVTLALSAGSAGNAAAASSDANAAASATPDRHGSLFVDPLGLALFGPRLGVEVGGSRLSVAASARWFNGGLLAHSLFLGSGDEFAFSYGAGLRARYYLADALAGAHFGLAAEYLHTRIDNSGELISTQSSYLVPYVEAGYRLPLGGFYGDASAGFGYAARLSGSVSDLPGGQSASQFAAEDKSSVYATASLDLGLYF
jgi:hypothetical protein